MSVSRLLEAYPDLGPEMLLLLNLQMSKGPVNIPDVDELHSFGDDYGRPFVVYHASSYLQSGDGRSDMNYIIKLIEREMHEERNCFETRRSCPCKPECRQECDALLDLPLRMLHTIVKVVKHAAEEVEIDNLMGN